MRHQDVMGVFCIGTGDIRMRYKRVTRFMEVGQYRIAALGLNPIQLRGLSCSIRFTIGTDNGVCIFQFIITSSYSDNLMNDNAFYLFYTPKAPTGITATPSFRIYP